MILLVEDDEAIQESLKEILTMKNYGVVQAYNLKQALSLFSKEISLIIMDIQLPDGNGVTLCQEIRKVSQVPILFLTVRNDEATIVEALNAGGDDYITKPFRVNELLARMKSIERRLVKEEWIIETGDLYIDMKKYIVKKHNEEIQLSGIGYEILFLLVQNQGMILTRERMTEFIEERTHHIIEDNTVSVHMKRLREKLGQYQQLEYIETIRGIGYRWKNI